MMLTGFTWVIEGDVKACFDEISHKAILGCLREKVMDNRFLELIRHFLKAGCQRSMALFIRPRRVCRKAVLLLHCWPTWS